MTEREQWKLIAAPYWSTIRAWHEVLRGMGYPNETLRRHIRLMVRQHRSALVAALWDQRAWRLEGKSPLLWKLTYG